ncbi:MAG: bifunctional demethylmenaquinone methyltransferase/2-methoxy-6-polyprenyl-1,4-benzoquinol methylase UbiE [Bacteroidales bacterium]
MTLDKSNEKIGGMFDAIAPTYDKLNHILSLNADKKWRKRAVDELLINNPTHILDVATGSGDMILEILNRGNYQISAIDISQKMIEIAKHKINRLFNEKSVEFVLSSAELIPFADNVFDGVTVAFGVRNFENLEMGLSEIKRVLKTGGHLVILEFVKPLNKFTKTFLGFYLKYFLPLIGKLISKNKEAYHYLNQSISEFYNIRDFENICKRLGFQIIKTKVLFMGLVAIFVLKK